MKRLAILAGTVIAVAFAFIASSGAQQQVTLPPVFITDIVRGEPGTIHPVAILDVPDELIGQLCDVTITGANNSSVHPDSNIILRGGGDEVIIPDVEGVAGQVISGSATVTVEATEIEVLVQLGPDGIFSGAATAVEGVCTIAPPPTTVPTDILPPVTSPPVSTPVPVPPPPPPVTTPLPHTL